MRLTNRALTICNLLFGSIEHWVLRQHHWARFVGWMSGFAVPSVRTDRELASLAHGSGIWILLGASAYALGLDLPNLPLWGLSAVVGGIALGIAGALFARAGWLGGLLLGDAVLRLRNMGLIAPLFSTPSLRHSLSCWEFGRCRSLLARLP